MPGKVCIATTTYSVFTPIIYLTRTCSFLPVQIRTLGHATTITWSWSYYCVSLAAFLCMMVWIVFGLVKSYGIDDVYNIRLNQLSGKFITILDDTYLLLTFMTGAVTTPLIFKHYCIYMRCLNKADTLLKRPITEEKRKGCIFLLLTLTLTISVLGLDMAVWWTYVFSKHINVALYLLYNLPFYYTYFLVMVIEMNYWYLVHMVNVRLINMNDSLAEKYNQYKSINAGKKMAQKLKADLGSNVNLSKASSKDPTVSIISNLIKIYELLFETSNAVNNFYGTNILLVIIGCFVHLLVTPYDLYLELKHKNYTFIFPQFCWMVSHVLRLMVVVEPCHSASQEVKRASSTICQFLSLEVPEELHFQLEIFDIQLFHCPIHYTACGMVVLDRSLITKIAGAVTTYLVILFQFEN